MSEDVINRIVAEWKTVRPDLQTTTMETVGRILRINLHICASIEKVIMGFGLNMGEFDTLATLRRSGAPYCLSPTQLYTELLLSSGSMTNRLNRLESRGLVARVADPADRRGLLVELTAEGAKLIDAAMDAHLLNEASILSPFSADEQQALANSLSRWLVFLSDIPHTDAANN